MRDDHMHYLLDSIILVCFKVSRSKKQNINKERPKNNHRLKEIKKI